MKESSTFQGSCQLQGTMATHQSQHLDYFDQGQHAYTGS